MINYKILVGEVSSYKAVVICEYLQTHYKNIIIYTYDKKSFTKYIYTKYSDKHFVLSSRNIEKGLQSIILDYKIDFFFPVINSSLNLFWKRKNEYHGSLDYLGDYESYNLLNNKSTLHTIAESLNILVPKKYNKYDEAIFPFVVKPTNQSSAKGVFYVNKSKDIPRLKDMKNIIIQQYVMGVGVGYSFYCKGGKIINGYGHKRIAEYPVSGGSSTYREGYYNPLMQEVSQKIVNHLKYTGFAMFEFKLTVDNALYLLEVNPRIWGSINQGMMNGTKYFEGILGEPDIPIITRKKELKTYLSPLVFTSLFKYGIKGRFKPVIYFLKNITSNSPDVNAFNDPTGFMSTILRKVL
jgi:predicted ATP-grasp superfamily ATP-dependent carboligase